jgi:hypothetical protein
VRQRGRGKGEWLILFSSRFFHPPEKTFQLQSMRACVCMMHTCTRRDAAAASTCTPREGVLCEVLPLLESVVSVERVRSATCKLKTKWRRERMCVKPYLEAVRAIPGRADSGAAAVDAGVPPPAPRQRAAGGAVHVERC